MRFQIFLLAGWWVLAALAPASAGPNHLQEIKVALEQGQYRDAETLAGEALTEPGLDLLLQCRLHVARGLARQAQGLADSALIDFTQSLSENALPYAERAVALFDRGVALDSLGRLDDAIGDYSAALRITPGASNALNNRANAYRRQGHLTEAHRDYLAALASDGGHAQYPYFGIGQIAEAQGDTVAARDFYGKALAVDPDYQLATDRLQALGAADWTPADPDVIVLHPPRTAAIVLHPPPAKTDQIAAEPQKATMHTPSRSASTGPGTGNPAEAPLRPAIVESQRQAGIRGALVQLGAWRSEAEAQAGWALARTQAGTLLEGLTPVIVTTELPGRGRYYRLRIPPRGAASQFCTALIAISLACFPIHD